MKNYMAVADDRLHRNYPDYWKSLLQDVCFVETVSQFTWARLAALVVGEMTAGMLRSDAVRAAHVCSGFMVMRFFGDLKKMSWALCLLEASRVGFSNLVAWTTRLLLQARFSKNKIKRGLVFVEGNSMVNSSHGASTWLHRLNSQTPSDDGL